MHSKCTSQQQRNVIIGKKGSKKGKKKKDKDLTPDRTTESLFEELVMNNVIKPYPQVI